ncbi:LPXTG cell wall anchor domain-containing protein [Planosporangium thailandense]|uniref:LPXTG cell wall anchor domain-containing protein n=1 Tax=Planosporangium thailandense TaxID=765197 RepID=A0ABX0XTE4_9ACTN|nr:LPXTG cell wall anchor domain-containing protein [Planosporangium thailandense]NJC68710.1 LPXTG cell wall anchor domain-containing protein [Planosporangium thailandense]
MNRTPRTWAARIGVSAAAAVALGAAALPAHADVTEPPSASASLDTNLTIGGPGSHGKAVPVYVDATRATGLKVTFDVSGLAGVATVTFPDNCKAAGPVETCTFANAAELHEIMPLVLRPAAGAKAGDSGKISLTTSADGLTAYTSTSTVTLADGVDMVMLSGRVKTGTAKPHDKVGVPVSFMNAGNQPADGYQITLFFDHGLVPDTYTNCKYGEDHTTHVVVCTFTDPADAMAPGDAVQMDDFGATVSGDAFGAEATDFRVDGLTTANAARAGLTLSARAGGRTLHVKRIASPRATVKAAEIYDNDNWGFADWDVANTNDVGAIGATASGQVGDVVSVTVGLKNNGPGSLDSTRAAEPALAFVFEVPPGTQVTSAPQTCASVTDDAGTPREQPGQPGGAYYRCRSGNFMAAGATLSATFKLKITKVSPDASGTVGLANPYVSSVPGWIHDANPANDQARVVINPTSGGSGGGSGSGTLPITGAQTGLLVAGGVVLLGGGGAMYLFARRRRIVLVADGDGRAS